jgi:hypothetical protein
MPERWHGVSVRGERPQHAGHHPAVPGAWPCRADLRKGDCWRTRVCCTASPGSATTSNDAHAGITPRSPLLPGVVPGPGLDSFSGADGRNGGRGPTESRNAPRSAPGTRSVIRTARNARWVPGSSGATSGRMTGQSGEPTWPAAPRVMGRGRSVHGGGYPVPVEHLPELGPSLCRWMRVVVAGRQGFRVQPEDRGELGVVDAGVADESKQFRILLE